MAKPAIDSKLFNRMRDLGLRKNVARTVAKATEQAKGDGRPPKVVRDTIGNLKAVTDELDRRFGDSAGEKAAKTRQQNAAKRSNAAQKAAKTRQQKAAKGSNAAKKGTSSRS